MFIPQMPCSTQWPCLGSNVDRTCCRQRQSVHCVVRIGEHAPCGCGQHQATIGACKMQCRQRLLFDSGNSEWTPWVSAHTGIYRTCWVLVYVWKAFVGLWFVHPEENLRCKDLHACVLNSSSWSLSASKHPCMYKYTYAHPVEEAWEWKPCVESCCLCSSVLALCQIQHSDGGEGL